MFFRQSAPPGTVVSMRSPLCVDTTIRTPLLNGSTVSVMPVSTPLKDRSSEPGELSLLSRSWPLPAVPPLFGHASHASPTPSLSASAWFGFGTVRQLSQRSPTPSPSASWKVAGGHCPFPSQNSGESHAFWRARPCVVVGSPASVGQSLLTPLQLSAMSQMPDWGRQGAVLFASVGQSTDPPVHRSTRSHTPAAGRHTELMGASASGGQVALV